MVLFPLTCVCFLAASKLDAASGRQLRQTVGSTWIDGAATLTRCYGNFVTLVFVVVSFLIFVAIRITSSIVPAPVVCGLGPQFF